MNELDYTIEALDDGTFEVWTPDINGACIGKGEAEKDALFNALVNLVGTAKSIAEKQLGLSQQRGLLQ